MTRRKQEATAVAEETKPVAETVEAPKRRSRKAQAAVAEVAQTVAEETIPEMPTPEEIDAATDAAIAAGAEENLTGMTVAQEIEMSMEAEARDGGVAVETVTGEIVAAEEANARPARVVRAKPDFTFEQAKAITARIYTRTGELWALLEEARDRKAWSVIGYTSFEDYMRTEFDLSQRYANRLINQGQVIRRLSAAAGADVRVSERQARDIASNIDAVAAQVAEAANGAADPAAAAVEVVEAVRAPRVEAERQRKATAVTSQETEAARRREERAQEREEARKQAEAAQKATDPGTALLAAVERLNDASEAMLNATSTKVDPQTASIVADAIEGHLEIMANWLRQFRNEVLASHALEAQAAEAVAEPTMNPDDIEVAAMAAEAEYVATGVPPVEVATGATADVSPDALDF